MTPLRLIGDGSGDGQPFEVWFEVDGMRNSVIPRKVDGRAVYRDLGQAWATAWLGSIGRDATRRQALERVLQGQWRRVDEQSGESVFLVADARA